MENRRTRITKSESDEELDNLQNKGCVMIKGVLRIADPNKRGYFIPYKKKEKVVIGEWTEKVNDEAISLEEIKLLIKK